MVECESKRFALYGVPLGYGICVECRCLVSVFPDPQYLDESRAPVRMARHCPLPSDRLGAPLDSPPQGADANPPF